MLERNSTPIISSDTSLDVSPRAAELSQELENNCYILTSRLFAVLMTIQWLAGIAAALWISPLTWAGLTSRVHLHVWLSFSVAALPLYPYSWRSRVPALRSRATRLLYARC